MLRCLIIGGGVQGMHLARVLTDAGGIGADDVRVLDPIEDPPFPLQAGREFRAGGFPREHLEGDLLPSGAIGEVDLAHASRSEKPPGTIGADPP